MPMASQVISPPTTAMLSFPMTIGLLTDDHSLLNVFDPPYYFSVIFP
jgi:hypothetical protein